MAGEIALLAAALGFVVVSGMNDGASVLAMALRAPSVPPWIALAALVAAVVVAPLVVGTGVATTLASELVTFDAGAADSVRGAAGAAGAAGDAATRPVIAALVAAIVVVAGLARRGLPTSVALALVGGIVGAGLGHGLPTRWRTVALVLAVAAASPVAGAAIGWVLARLTVLGYEMSGSRPGARWLHPVGFGLLALAYGSNGGQKMLAVLTLGLGLGAGASSGADDAGRAVTADPARLVVVAAVFAVGVLLGLRRVAGSLGTGVMSVRAAHAANSELAAATAVLASTGLGVPVSLTQATTAALVGSGLSERRRLRWGHAGRIARAWLLTLPAAVLLGALGGWLGRL